MNVTLDQVFYGRGERGYAILGASSGAAGFASRVESLCGAVGTSGSEYGGDPFLLSVPGKDHVIMVCGRRGVPDAMGRATLFFHVLIGAKQELVAENADAFALFEQGVFTDRMPAGEIPLLRLDVGSVSGKLGGRRLDVVLPCLFRSERPAPGLVRSAVGDRVNDLAWATFTFQPLPDFDVQVLPLRVLAPRTMNEYDKSGVIVRQAVVKSDVRVTARPDNEHRRPLPSAAPVTDAPPPEKSNAMLKFSLVLNLVLAAACAVLYASRKSASDTPSPTPVPQVTVPDNVKKEMPGNEKPDAKKVDVPLSVEQKVVIERAAVRQLKEQLKKQFKEQFKGEQISNFDREMAKIPQVELNAEGRAVVDKDFSKPETKPELEGMMNGLRSYVDFVNSEILEVKKP